jgi:hypothetical protein
MNVGHHEDSAVCHDHVDKSMITNSSCDLGMVYLNAALITLALMAAGCTKVMLKNLEQGVYMILNGFQNPHPCVRWAASNAIGQLSTELGPDL